MIQWIEQVTAMRLFLLHSFIVLQIEGRYAARLVI